MSTIAPYISSSIGKKQVVATTGLILILFLVGHLAGNLFIYGGPSAYNQYAAKLASLRPGLYIVEFALAGVFFIHVYFTTLVVIENIRARGGLTRYGVDNAVGERSWATRLMPYTGTMILIFVYQHLMDFTFIPHEGSRTVLADGVSYGLYGIVYNAFRDPGHSCFYIVAMVCLALHLSHGIQSCFQTFGWAENNLPVVRKISNILALVVALAYSSIPVYVLLDSWKYRI